MTAISIILNYIMVLVLAINIQAIWLNMKRLVLSKFGYGFVKVVGNDKKVHTNFLKIDSNAMKGLMAKYGIKAIDPRCLVTENHCPTYYYKTGYVEPINFFDPVIVDIPITNNKGQTITQAYKVAPFGLGTSNHLADNLLNSEIHAVDIGQLKKNQMMYKLLIGAVVLAGAAALFAFSADDKLTQILAYYKGASILVK